MSELPNGWRRVPLNEVAEVRLGRQRSPDRAMGDHMRPYMRAANVTWDGICLDDVKEMDFSPKEFETYQLREGDILLSEASGSASEVGKPAIWRNEVEGACFQNTLIRVRSRGPLPEYLHLHFLADARLGRFASAGKGIGINHLGADRMSSWPTALPPLDEQRRIVAKLEALQARGRRARQALDAVPPLLEKLRQSILAAAFRGDLTKDWRAKNKDVEPATKLLERIRLERRKKWEESELAKMKAKGKPPTDDKWKSKYKEPSPVDATGLPELPQGWCWASVDDVSDLQLGQQRAPIHAAAEETHPYIRTANITWDGLDLSDVKRMGFPDPERYRLRAGDVLLSEASGSPTEVGKPAIWRDEIPGCCYQKTLLRARPRSPEVSSEWLHLCFLADALLGRFARMAPGVGILHLTADRMLSWPVAIPPRGEQARGLELATASLGTIAKLEDSLGATSAYVATFERAVLARAFSGELVPQDPSEEPTEVTLSHTSAMEGAPSAGGTARPRKRRTGGTSGARQEEA